MIEVKGGCLVTACIDLLGRVPKGMLGIVRFNKGFPVQSFGWLESTANLKVLGAEDQAVALRFGSKVIIVTELAEGTLHACCMLAKDVPEDNGYAYGIYRLEDRLGGVSENHQTAAA